MVRFREHVGASLAALMEADNRVVVLGEGVTDPKGVFGTTLEAYRRFPGRVLEMPLSENMFTGAAIGMALDGWKPVLVHARFEFGLLSLPHLVNNAAKLYLNGTPLPLVLRCIIGRGWGQGANHSGNFSGLFAQVPGLTVCQPVNGKSWTTSFTEALTEGKPTILVEHRSLYETDITAPWDGARPVAIVMTIGDAILDALEAKGILAQDYGLNVAVVPYMDLIEFTPPYLPMVLVETAPPNYWGMKAVADWQRTDCDVIRVGPMTGYPPASPRLEADWYPTPHHVVEAVCQTLGRAYKRPKAAAPRAQPYRGAF